MSAVCLDSGELACRHRRIFAAHQELTAPCHQQALDQRRRERYTRERAPREVEVEVRPLSRYDALIPA